MDNRDEVIVAVAAVMTDAQGRILLSLRSEPPKRGYWHHPGGTPEFGESLHQALRRELREEIGIETEVTSAQPVFVSQTIIPREGRHIICLFYEARILSGQPKPGQGTAMVGYFGETEARDLRLLDSCRDFLNKRHGWRL
jgi:ADP-ribose pyrophosphatase YjhB (NUDIX family)